MGAIFSHWVELCNEQGGRQLLKNNGELILVSVCCFSINLPWLHQWYCEAIGFETYCFLPWMIISLRWCWKKFIFVVPKLVCNIQWWRDGHICQDKGPESQEKVESGQIFYKFFVRSGMTALATETKKALWIQASLNPVKIEKIFHGTC